MIDFNIQFQNVCNFLRHSRFAAGMFGGDSSPYNYYPDFFFGKWVISIIITLDIFFQTECEGNCDSMKCAGGCMSSKDFNYFSLIGNDLGIIELRR